VLGWAHVIEGDAVPRHRLRTDLNHLVSWVLLASAAATIATGIIADAWDLNGFRIHTVAGYVMTVAAMAHVALSWNRLMSYARFRASHLRRTLTASGRPTDRRTPSPGRRTSDTKPSRTGGHTFPRRGLIGLVAVGVAGFVAGRGLRQPPAIPHGSDVGVIYHEWSKPGVTDALGTLVNWGGKPPLYKDYGDAPFIALPDRPLASDMPLGDAVQRRHSTREYAGTPLSAETLGALVRHAGGLRDGSTGRRTAPSSGALYPIEIYPVVNDVTGVDPGVYHYDIRRHGLSRVRAGAVGEDVMRYGLDQDFLATANVVVVLTLIHQRMRFKYRDRSYRYGLLEAGHLGQNLYLTAATLGLGACAVGAFHDDGINDLLGVDGREEVAVYLLAAGNGAA
jgi:SagB-type dehydrogenase family enzyme